MLKNKDMAANIEIHTIKGKWWWPAAYWTELAALFITINIGIYAIRLLANV